MSFSISRDDGDYNADIFYTSDGESKPNRHVGYPLTKHDLILLTSTESIAVDARL